MNIYSEMKRCENLFNDDSDRLLSAAYMMQYALKREDIKETGLTANEFLLVLFAKGVRTNLQDISIETIENTSKCAFSDECPKKAIKTLSKLTGVKTSVASAILTWVFPEKFAILDFHSARTSLYFKVVNFYKRGTTHSKEPEDQMTPDNYIEFLNAVREISKKVSRTPQEVDIWMYNYSICRWGRRGAAE